MNVVNKLTLRHLKEKKGRTVVTAMGIIVSVAMITAVFVAIASFLNFFGGAIISSGGDYHFTVIDSKENLVEYIEKDSAVESVGYECFLSDEERGYQLKEGVSKHLSTGDWTVGDSEFLKKFVTCDYDGSLPEKENEIMVEQSLIEKNKLNWKIGDTVEIPSGFRCIPSEASQAIATGRYDFGEEFTESFTKKYKIVGILKGNGPTKHTGDLIRFAEENENTARVSAAVKMKDVNPKTLDEINRIIDKFHFTKKEMKMNVSVNNDYLETKFAIDPDNSSVMSLLPMCIIILAIIMIVSVALIYNAFGMSYAEKVHYLGMLSSVGATKKQKRNSVFFEGLVLGGIGLPIGFGAGVLGIWITLSLLGKRIIESGIINGAESGDFNVVVPLYAVVCILILSIITIFISIIRPAVKTSSITPIDAIRQTNEIKVKKKIRTPRIVRKIFGYEGELAHKNLKRNGRKSRIITVSIAISVIMFLSCNYFCDMFVRANNMQNEMPYQVTASVTSVDKHSEFEKMLSEYGDIDDFYRIECDFDNRSRYETLEEQADENVKKLSNFDEFMNEKTVVPKYKKLIDSEGFTFFFNFVDDEDFNQLCRDNGIDYKKYYSVKSSYSDTESASSLNVLVMNNIEHKNGGNEIFTKELLGKARHPKCIDKDGKTIEMYEEYVFSDFVEYDDSNYLCHLNSVNTVSCYAPVSVMEKAYRYGIDGSEFTRLYGIVTDNHEKVTEYLNDYLEQNEYGEGCGVSDMVDTMQVINSTIFVLQVLIYGFIALTTLITIFNIINTISTGIALRKKEFAMLKSVGTTPKGFNKMIMLESAFYGIKALVFGIPISILVSYFMNYGLGSESIPFEINIPMYLAVIAVVFVIIGVTMIYSVRKLKDDSIVETLKEEIN